ncbi:hypothetical protein [Hyphomonas sp.]|uniref:hypothetical protein n=1 Tax=Hyphomonas sp. TaxID=87 RepID=UPI003919BFB4
MTEDYYSLPPPEKKKGWPAERWALLLFLLLLLAIWPTVCSLRSVPESTLVSSIPPAPVAAPIERAAIPAPMPEPEPEPEPAPVIEEADDPDGLPASAGSEEVPEVIETAEEPAAEPEMFASARWREVAAFSGADPAGREAEFTAYVLVSEQTWTFARADELFAAGMGEPVETAFETLDLGPAVCSLTRVIAVGAASVEGTPERNTWLSRARGEALRTAIEANLACEDSPVDGRVLDLGYSTARIPCPAGEALCPDLTAPQRSVAMILARAEDPETDIGAALRAGVQAMEAAGEDVLPGVRVSEYSGFATGFDRL